MPDVNTRRRAARGHDAGSDRRAVRGAARRRKLRARMWLVTVPVVVVIAVVVTLLVVFGGQKSQEGVIASSTTTLPGPAPKGTLLLVEQGEDIPLLVLLQSRSAGGVVLAIPGMTLLKAGDSYELVSAIAAGGKADVLTGALGDAFAAQVNSVARVTWSDLRKALINGNSGGAVLPDALTSGQGEADQVAAAVLTLLRDTGGAGRWGQLPLSGDSSQFRAAVSAFAAGAGNWISAAVTGTVVPSADSTYLNPNADVVKALLTATSGAAIKVEVQNGSGVIGVAERAVTQLKPLGYDVAAAGNSTDFPGVEQTRIEVFTGETAVGARVRGALGAGAVGENEAVTPGHVVVVIGKDYNPLPSGNAADVAGVSAQ